MPRHAILTTQPDYVLPVQEMPSVLLRYVAHDYLKQGRVEEPADARRAAQLKTVADAVRMVTGRDFADYKSGTLQRRVARRMALLAIDSWEDYIKLLRRSPMEAEALAKDLLIHVTQFFRDPEAFGYLADHVLPDLLGRHPPDQPVRIWVPGCSTGEEAYSLGILLLEQIARSSRRLKLQIFATDVDEDALRVARAGDLPPKSGPIGKLVHFWSWHHD